MTLSWEIVAFALIQTGGFIWWMATTTNELKNIISLVKEIQVNTAGFAKKEDVDKEFGKIQKDVDAAHRRIDEIQLKHS